MSKLSNNKGFTIIESTVAILIILIALFGITQFFPLGIRIIGDSQSQTVASNVALTKIEELRSLNYEEISTGTIETKNRVSSDPANTLFNFQRQTIVETVDNNFNPSASDVGLKKITTTVYWQSPVVSKEKSITLQYIIANY